MRGQNRWNARRNEGSKKEQQMLEKVFEEALRGRAPQVLKELEPSKKQQAMQLVANYVRAIVEVCPRGQCAELVDEWRKVADMNMRTLCETT